MSVELKIRERILKAVADVRNAAAHHNLNHGYMPTASIHQFPAKPAAAKAQPSEKKKLHQMLPKPHTSIW